MTRRIPTRRALPWAAAGIFFAVAASVGYAVQPVDGGLGAPRTLNPCGARTPNPCAAKTLNPCAARTPNPCAAKKASGAGDTGKVPAGNPCGAKWNPCNPCGAKRNPCNPCGPARVDPSRVRQPRGATLVEGRGTTLVSEGEKLWNDRALGKSGLACATCHVDRYGQMKDTFANPFPHYVEMPAQQAGLEKVNAAEMVQFCMVVPMAADPLPWGSRELAALTAYVEHIQADYDLGGGAGPINPCATKRNPCNPCAGRRNPGSESHSR